MRLLGAIICLLLAPQAAQSGDSQCGEAQGGCADSEQVGSPAPSERSVADTELQLCSLSPRTGWFRDGYCRTNAADTGRHTVCAQVTQQFLTFTAARGNDLSSPRGRFPGLKPGDRWCLCAVRWAEAYKAGKAPPVDLEATHQRTLRYVSYQALQSRSAAR